MKEDSLLQKENRSPKQANTPSDVRWHHISDVKRNPELADVPNNVRPSRGEAAGHVQNFHPNGTRAGSSGPLLDRDALKNQHLNGER